MYGSNNEIYKSVTRKNGAFEKVKENAIQFLKLREHNNSNVKFGFNYIILPGLEKDVIEVAKYILDINQKSNNSVDFLTLREDYSNPEDHNSLANQKKLIDVFDELKSLTKESENVYRLRICTSQSKYRQNRKNTRTCKLYTNAAKSISSIKYSC